MDDILLYFIFSIIGYVSGSVMYSYLIAKYFCGVNIIEKGEDHNPGMTNVMNCVNKRTGILCMILDVAKGFIPVFLAGYFLDFSHPLFSLVVISPVLGHAFPPMLKLKGGKAIASTYGVLLALSLVSHSVIVLLLALSMAFFSLIVIIRPHSLRVIVSMLLFVILCVIFYCEPSFLFSSIGVSVVVIYKHITNYGTEKKSLKILFKKL